MFIGITGLIRQGEEFIDNLNQLIDDLPKSWKFNVKVFSDLNDHFYYLHHINNRVFLNFGIQESFSFTNAVVYYKYEENYYWLSASKLGVRVCMTNLSVINSNCITLDPDKDNNYISRIEGYSIKKISFEQFLKDLNLGEEDKSLEEKGSDFHKIM